VAISGIPRAGVTAFIVRDLLVADVYIVRLWGSLKSLLLVPQVLNFKPQPLNLLV